MFGFSKNYYIKAQKGDILTCYVSYVGNDIECTINKKFAKKYSSEKDAEKDLNIIKKSIAGQGYEITICK